MIDVNTPEGRKALRELCNRHGALPTLEETRDAFEAVPALLDALEASERDSSIAKIPTDVTEGEVGNVLPACPRCGGKLERDRIHYECRSWRVLTGGIVHTYMCDRFAALQSENAALRSRVAALERVREAAEAWANKDHGAFDEQDGTYYCVVCSSHIPILGEAAAHATHCPVTALRAALAGCPPVAKGE